jgi:sec-independent protein translocase protein TatA
MHMPSGIEWILIFVAALILFGPKKLPELGSAVGKAIREFKNATSGIMNDDDTMNKTSAPSAQAQAQPANEMKTETKEQTTQQK